MAKRRLCVVTGSRAEYGLLHSLMKGIQSDADLELQIIATGMHLSPEYGSTFRVIEQDGFLIDAKVEMLLSSDTPVGIAKSIGLGTIGMADALARLQPDLLVLLGDRFEILAAAQAALVARIPVAHLYGGDSTEGAFDEAIRHSITKMAHLHFVSNADAARRVRQLGECPAQIHLVGSTGIDQIKCLELLGRRQLEEKLGLSFREKNLLITFHPATLEGESPAAQFQELLLALDRLGSAVGLIFTKPNADTAGRALIPLLEGYARTRDHARVFTSLGQQLYLSVMAQVSAVVGNSSSGLYEAPSFKVPTVNIGARQEGRLQAASVLNCKPFSAEIEKTIRRAFRLDCSEVMNPYGDGASTGRILAVLKAADLNADLLRKRFYDLETNG